MHTPAGVRCAHISGVTLLVPAKINLKLGNLRISPPPGLQPLELGGLDRRAAKPAARIFPPLSQRDARNSRQFSWHVFVNTYPEQQSRQL